MTIVATNNSMPPFPDGGVDTWMREADAVTLPRLGQVDAHPRPSTIGSTYAEQEYDALGDEQEFAWTAWSENVARSHTARSSGLQAEVTATNFVLAEAAKEVSAAHQDYQHGARLLTPYVRRGPHEKTRYWIAWLVLVMGDTGGVWSAAVVAGDVPLIAFFQALASGTAAACAGLIGSELKDIRMARTRQFDPATLTEDEKRYRRLFIAKSDGLGIVKLVGLLSLLVVVLVAIGVYALRTSIEGQTAGLTFGLLAAATAVGSGLLSYFAADEVADQLATMAKRARTSERRYLKLAKSGALRSQATAEATRTSLSVEAGARGAAAAKRVESLRWRVARRNPQVLGHGFPAGQPEGVIGRRPRRGGGA
ncbi:hypothetical protein [Umezawaea sp. Da 62-37]|uniref:hypothetical protein n=1 Tax=Umezawaea sp. Da 62-37 TaxID=3075927 RepID=UPI0028F6CA01|nr:hypothetical protein [Umezawaea sp. Da 62-37]WNV83473.1 hypothetical protein RM788_35585 [Umezawaea sp. Da 62-37]